MEQEKQAKGGHASDPSKTRLGTDTVILDNVKYRIVGAVRVATPIDKVTWDRHVPKVADGGTLRYVAARLEKIA